MKRGLVIAGSVAAAAPVVAVGIVVYLANVRGEEIAAERAKLEQSQATGKIWRAFQATRGSLVMKDGSRQLVEGASAILVSVKPVATQKRTWLALGRTGSGTYFAQQFGLGADGVMGPLGDPQEIAVEAALSAVRAHVAESGGSAEAAQDFLKAVSIGQPAQVQR